MSPSRTIARRRLQRPLDLLRTPSLGLSWIATAGLVLLACVAFPRARADEKQGGVGAKDGSVDPDGARPQFDLLGRPLPIVERLDNAALPKHLAKIWHDQRQEIRSAKIRFRQLSCSEWNDKDPLQQGHGLVPRSREEVNALLERFDLAQDPGCLRKLRDQLLFGQLILDRPVYRVITIAMDGPKLRIDWDDGESRVFDGENCIVCEPSLHQATITNRLPAMPRSPISCNLAMIPGHILDGLRTVPAIYKLIPATIDRRGSVATLQYLPERNTYAQEITVDGYGALYRMTSRLSVYQPLTHQMESGPIQQETIQSGHLNYPGNILFPSVRVATNYPYGDRLQMITISILEEASFNEPVPPETFVAAVPENTAVWDKRKGLKLRAAEKAVGNVLTLFEK